MKILHTRDEARRGGSLRGLPDRILKAERANPAADISAQEREIDDRVYRLYGLDKDEIKTVEESAK
jgi:hypothetical protein